MATMKYHLRFLLKNVEDFFYFEVTEEEQDRLSRILNNPPEDRTPFFLTDTLDGYRIVVAIPAIQAVNLCWEISEGAEDLAKQFWQKTLDTEFRMDFLVYFRGRSESMQFLTCESNHLETMLFELDAILHDEDLFLSFQDEDDETMFLQANEIAAIITPLATLNSE